MSTPKITYRQYGGKASIAKWIVSRLPQHRVYMEPCCASAAVLLAKPRSFIEIVNDLDDGIMAMWRAIQSQPEQLAALLWATPYTAANWRQQPVDDIDKAVLLVAQGGQFYCGNGNNHMGRGQVRCRAQAFARGVGELVPAPVLPAANRMRAVELLHEDALTAIERVYQKSDALLYVDPPYVGHEHEYRYRLDYPGMVELLKAATAKVVVSSRRPPTPTSPTGIESSNTPRRGACRAPWQVQQQG